MCFTCSRSLATSISDNRGAMATTTTTNTTRSESPEIGLCDVWFFTIAIFPSAAAAAAGTQHVCGAQHTAPNFASYVWLRFLVGHAACLHPLRRISSQV